MPSIAECVAQATERLSHGVHPERARQDAETLLGAVLKRNKAWMLAHAGDAVPEPAIQPFAEQVERRSFGEPIQYVLGETEFYRMPFRVTRDVLIPRPETEQLVERAILLARSMDKPRILDLGTGSGAIAIALAKHLTDARIVATDLSGAALELAELNAGTNEVLSRIRFLPGDLLEPVAGEQFELIVSNPPYVAERDRETLTVEVRDYEPAEALFAGEDGLAVYRRLIPAAWAALVLGGWIVLEIGYGQETSVRELLSEAGFAEIDCAADLQGIARVVSARRP